MRKNSAKPSGTAWINPPNRESVGGFAGLAGKEPRLGLAQVAQKLLVVGDGLFDELLEVREARQEAMPAENK